MCSLFRRLLKMNRILYASFAVMVCGLSMASAADGPLGSGIDRGTFDPSVKPGQDFFLHVNGTWLKNNPIPADQTRWGSFSELRERDLQELKDILEGLASSPPPSDEDRRKLRDLFATAMDEAKLQKDGASPLKGEFGRIAALK